MKNEYDYEDQDKGALSETQQEEIRGPLREYGIHIKKWGVTKAILVAILVGSFIWPQIFPYLLAALIISAVRTW